MQKSMYWLWLFVTCFHVSFEVQGSLTSFARLFGGRNEKKDSVVTNTSRLKKQLQTIQQERASFESKREPLRTHIEQLAQELSRMQQRPDSNRSGQAFVAKKISLLSQQHATLIEQEGTVQKIVVVLDRLRALLEDQLSHESAPAVSEAPVQAIYGFQEIQAAQQRVADMQAKLAEEERVRTVSLDEFAKRKKALALAESEYSERKLEQETFATNAVVTHVQDGLTTAQQGALIDLAERLALYRQEIAQLRVVESEHKLSLSELQTAVYRIQLSECKRAFTRIRKSARVSREFVKQAEEALEQKRTAMLFARERTNEKLRMVSERQASVQERLRTEQAKDPQAVLDLSSSKWLVKPPVTMSEWHDATTALDVMTDALLYHVEYEFLTAQSELENAQFKKDELEVLIIRAWHRITMRDARYRSDEEVEQETKSFELIKTELEGQLISLTSSLDSSVSRLDQFNSTFDRVRKLLLQLSQQRYSTFSRHQDDYASVAQQIEEVEEKTRRLLHWGGRLFELYSSTIAATKNNVHRVEVMIRELSSRAFWRRSDFSIDWSDLKNFVPDMRLFVRDLQQSCTQLSLGEISAAIWNGGISWWNESYSLIILLMRLFACLMGFILIRALIPTVVWACESLLKAHWIIRIPALFGSMAFGFIQRHVVSVYIWGLSCIIVRFAHQAHPLMAQLFYLITIPYGLWLVIHFIRYTLAWNRDQRYAVISEEYEQRVCAIMGVLLGSTVVLLCIREAFVLGEYHHSPVPSILLALLFVIGQVSAIALISRAQIVGLIPADTPLREWIHDQLNRYYYVIWALLIAVIVMSTPLVGYGRQVYYVLSRLLFTSLLVSLFSWIHQSVKRGATDLFFYYADRDVVKERFVTGRFWYSIFVLVTLMLFLTVGIYVTAKVWGYPVGPRDMWSWLQYSFYNPTDEVSGKIVPVSLLSVIQVLLYLFGGFVIAYIINTFVISRVLDPFIVEPGVQSTVVTLLRYVIIMLALFMGLSTTGLDGLMTKVGVVLVALGFAIKEILSDFFSYFILLVQRPVKVGDFIRVLDGLSTEDQVSLTGFVRAITPRSIIIRKRNSTTVIIPNSRIVTSPIMNWSYSRGFFAFDDMRITVPYGVDPAFVRQLFLEVLDKNPNILKNPAPIVRLEDFVDNGYNFLLRGYLTSHKIGEQWDIASEVRFQLVKTLRDHGIEVASPIRTVRLMPQEQHTLPLQGYTVSKEDKKV